MKHLKIPFAGSLTLLLGCAMLLSLPVVAGAQTEDLPFVDPSFYTLSRGKMWQCSYDWGLEGYDRYFNRTAYPGYSGNGGDTPNCFTNHRSWTYYMGCKDGYCLMQRQRRFGIDRTYLTYGEHQFVQNYNFALDPNMPEEYKIGQAISTDAVPQDGGLANLKLDFRCEKYVWSLPKYDDFLITRTVVKNIDTVPLTDVRVGWYLNMTPSLWGHNRGFRDDTEYLWRDDLPMALDEGEGTYIFFDDTEIRQASGTKTVYDIEPGATYGDRGDPGNIRTLGSIDTKLYSPQVVAYAIVDATPNKDGSMKAMYNILSAQDDHLDWSYKGGGIPGPEFFRYDTGADFGLYDEHMGYIGAKGNEQVRADWETLNANPDPRKPTDGSFFERVPTLFITGGPWDMAVGEEVEVWTFLIGGDADRNITMKGGLRAVELLENGAAVDNLYENWNAAWELYSAAKANGFTNWNAGITAYPPPTCGNTPAMGLDNELVVETFSEVVGGKPSQGYIIKWIPVPADYVDPLKGTNDFKEYRIYQSVIGIEGPWELKATVGKDEVVMDGDRAMLKIASASGIPSRWAVTSVDTDGNESGMTAFNYFAVAASPPPVDDMSQIRVIPNPFRQISGLLDPGESKRLTFVNVPAQCTIRIYTMAGDLLKEIEHEGFGEVSWGSNQGNNYMLTDFGHNVMPGIYIYHIESHVSGHEGETHVGKFAVLK